MDARAPQFWTHASAREAIAGRFNLKIGTDGGSGGDRASSTGWGVYAVFVGNDGLDGEHKLILKGGTYFPHGQNSLSVETKALDEALTTLVSFL